MENRGNNDGFVMKIDARGVILWTQTFGTSSDELFTGIAMSNNQQCLYVTGVYQGLCH